MSRILLRENVKHNCGVLNMKYSKHKRKNPLAGKGFYLALAACIAAVCIAAYAAAATISSTEENFASYSSKDLGYNSSSSSEPGSTHQAGQNVSDAIDTRPAESSKEAPSSSEKQTASEQSGGLAYTMPLKGSVGKNYSDKTLQYSKTYGDMRLHLGIDLQAAEGTDVVSAAKGTVTDVYDDSLWGKTVVIEHDFGITGRYCGLKNVTVNKGETISVGIKIGEVGVVPCEREDPSHIHIAIVREGKYISPIELLALKK